MYTPTMTLDKYPSIIRIRLQNLTNPNDRNKTMYTLLKWIIIAIIVVVGVFFGYRALLMKAVMGPLPFNTGSHISATEIEPISRTMTEMEYRYAVVRELRGIRETVEALDYRIFESIEDVFVRLSQNLPEFVWKGE